MLDRRNSQCRIFITCDRRGASQLKSTHVTKLIAYNRESTILSRSACRAPNGKYGRQDQRHSPLLIYARIAISEPAKTTLRTRTVRSKGKPSSHNTISARIPISCRASALARLRLTVREAVCHSREAELDLAVGSPSELSRRLYNQSPAVSSTSADQVQGRLTRPPTTSLRARPPTISFRLSRLRYLSPL
ncbi:unnamed protein product [Trichogramma brassicae]|uniref:Uncharacterized protein n=1 Tax=Trichogramma brassicae TaxID=86971 RepID=A0A6H5IS58_9HYME|nr:unnamed protein product [Trichogramma brassicae]